MDTVKLESNMDQPGKCLQCGTPLTPGPLGGLCPACLLNAGAAEDTVTEGKQPPFRPPSIAELAPLFPQLEILELIGKGGMGAVYKARQRQLDRIVALKILPPGIGDDPAFAERFAREAKALAKLNHPGIVTLYEFGRAELPLGHGKQAATLTPSLSHPLGEGVRRTGEGGLYFFLMEFVDGVNLRQLLQGGRISPHEALAIVPQICDALQYAHDQGIVHRDIKPENILMDRRGRLKVADFGLAKIVANGGRAELLLGQALQQQRPTSDLTDAGRVMGTPQYMSPEQIDAPGEVDHRADIYALGVVFYQMLTGELPGKKIEPPSRKVQIDVRLDEVVLRALEKSPELRWQTAMDLRTQVETIAETPPPSANRVAKAPLRAGESLYATAEFLATTWGAMKLHESMSMLSLYADRLVVGRGWQSTVIPFRAVRRLSVMSYPFWLSPMGRISILVEFEETGKLRRLALTPTKGMFPFLGDAKPRVAEWFRAIRDAITAAIGQPPAGSEVPELYRDFSSDGLMWAKLSMVCSPIMGLVALFWIFSSLSVNPVPSLVGIAAFVGGMLWIARIRRSEWQRNNPLPQTENERRGAGNPLPISDFRDALEAGDYGRAWDKAAPYFQRNQSRDEWVSRMETEHRPLGGIVDRKFLSHTIITPLTRMAVEILTTYANGQQLVEGVISAVQPDGEWKVEKYYTLPATGEAIAKAQANHATPPRFSRTAIAGACWLAFVPLHFLISFLIPSRNWFFEIIAFLQALLFWTAPIGISILGWLAVSQIRRSAGRLYGLWLAVFDGLLFPLLALTALVIGLPFSAWKLGLVPANGFGHTKGLIVLTIVASLVVAVWLNIYIIRRVWRAVNKPGGAAPATETAEKASDAGRNTPRAGHAFLVPLPRNRFLKWLAVTVLAAILIPIAIKVAWNASSKRAADAQQQARGALQIELGNKIAALLADQRRATYSTITFGSVPNSPDHAMVQFGGLQSWRDARNEPLPQPRRINGTFLLDFQPPNVWSVTGTGDLAGLGGIWLTATHGFPVWPEVPASRNPSAAQNHSFGPVVERVVHPEGARLFGLISLGLNREFALRQQTNPGSISLNLVDVDSGGVAGTVSLHPNDLDWLADHNIDLLSTMEKGQLQLSANGLALAKIKRADFDNAIAGDILNDRRLSNAKPTRGGIFSTETDDLTTWLFRTSGGGVGVLSVEALSPRSLRIRYKLVQSAGSITTSTSGFIRQSGTYQLDGGDALALTPSSGGRVSFALTRAEGAGRETFSIPDFFKQDGWFVYVESAERVWIFDGVRQLDVVAPDGRYSAGDLGVRALCPKTVWDAVPESVPKFYREPQVNEVSRDIGEPQKAFFGPVVEREQPFAEAFDPEAGTSWPSPFRPSGGSADQVRPGLQFSVNAERNELNLGGVAGFVPELLETDQWENITNPQAFDTLRNKFIPDEATVFAVAPAHPPQTFLFKTPTGRMSLLQVTGFTENPRGVKIRYKRVKGAVTTDKPVKS